MRTKTQNAPKMTGELLFATFAATAASLGLIALYSFALWRQWLTLESVSVMTIAMKVVSAGLAGVLVVKKKPSRAWLWGGLAGAAFSAFAYVVYSVLGDTFVISWAAATDMALGALAGMLSAMITGAA